MALSFPVALHLQDKACLVVGSNAEASERALALQAAGARVSVIAPEELAAPEHARLAESGILAERRAYAPRDLDDKWLAVLTDRDLALGARMASDALARRVFFCATDQPQANGYSHLALARAGTVTIAIGTEGRAPALGRRLREELTRLCERAGLAEFAARLAELRDALPPARRRHVLSERVQGVRFSGELELPPLD